MKTLMTCFLALSSLLYSQNLISPSFTVLDGSSLNYLDDSTDGSLNLFNKLITDHNPLTNDPNNTVFFEIKKDLLTTIKDEKPCNFDLNIPFLNNQMLSVSLQSFDAFTSDFQIARTTEDGVVYDNYTPETRSYKIIENGDFSGTISVFKNTVIGLIEKNGEAFEISQIDNNVFGLFKISDAVEELNFSCDTEDNSVAPNNISMNPQSGGSSGGSCIKMGVEIDYYTYAQFGDCYDVAEWVIATIAGVSEIYESELNTSIQLNFLHTWEVEEYCPYSNLSTWYGLSSYLDAFGGQLTSNSIFEGVESDVFHLFTRRELCSDNCGVADDIGSMSCDGLAYAICANMTLSNNAPVLNGLVGSYSLNIFVAAHELGHNVGSYHTHNCGWDPDPEYDFEGGAIDNCSYYTGYFAEEGCEANFNFLDWSEDTILFNTSVDYGTVMSYCYFNDLAEIRWEFHPIVKSQALMVGIENSCLGTDCPTAESSNCGTLTYGCTSELACNYNPDANVNDGSCECSSCDSGCAGMAELTWVPDPNFEAYLETNGMGDGEDNNQLVFTENIIFQTVLEVPTEGIEELTGIEAFLSLEYLDVSSNNLTELDLSSNTELTYLDFDYCYDLESVDISGNAALNHLTGRYTNLTTIDVSGNPELTILDFYAGDLTELDLSSNPELTSLNLRNCELNGELDLSTNTLLTYVNVYSNDLTGIILPNNALLTSLYCDFNHLTELDLSACTALTFLDCENNYDLTELILPTNTLLTSLYCDDNSLTELDLGNSPELTYLDCDNNDLTQLNVSGCPSLITLNVYNNALTELNVSNNTELVSLYCDYNQLSTIDISNLYLLNKLSTTGMDMCVNVWNLEYAMSLSEMENCSYYNSMLGVDLPCFNITSNSIFSLDCGQYTYGCTNPLACNYDATLDADYDDGSCLYPPVGSDDCDSDCDSDGNGICDDAELTWVPDPNFEAYLEENGMGDGEDNNQWVLTENIIGVEELYLVYQYITDMTGIEMFLSLQNLDLYYSYALTTIDLSNNYELMSVSVDACALIQIDLPNNCPTLTYLDLGFNDLTELDVSGFENLVTLDLESNDLTELDVSSNPILSTLNCTDNNLTELDVSSNPVLSYLYSGNNNLTVLDLSNNLGLDYLNCQSNNLGELDCSSNTDLDQLICSSNQLATISVGNNSTLDYLYCQNNNIQNLNVSGCSSLDYLYCQNNNLGQLDVSNNNYLTRLDCSGMTLCIEVADVDQAYEYEMCLGPYSWSPCWIKSASSEWTENCGEYAFGCTDPLACNYDPMADFDGGSCWYPPFGSDDCNSDCDSDGNGVCDDVELTYVPDPNFEAYLEENGMGDDDYSNQWVLTESIIFQTTLDLESLGIADLTGLENFISLTTLNLDGNSTLIEADLSNNTSLVDLSLSSCNLNNLDLDLPNLEGLDCYNNDLTELDVSSCPNLYTLECDGNNLTELDVSSCPNLFTLDCDFNDLTELDLSSNTELNSLYCNDNNLTELILPTNTLLTNLYCNDNNLTELDLGNSPGLQTLHCYNNNLTELDVSTCSSSLLSLYGDFNDLTELDLSSNTELVTLSVAYNNLGTIDVSSNIELNYLHCQGMGDICVEVWDVDYAIEREGNLCYDYVLGQYFNCFMKDNGAIWSLDCGEYVFGCTDENACNYDPMAEFSDGSCLYPPFGSDDCDSDCDSDGNGICDDAEFTSVPDANFEAYLEANGMGDDVDNNQLVLTENIINVPSLELFSLSILDLTGIENFVSLQVLEAGYNDLTELDLSNNTELMELECYNNYYLAELNLSNNTKLTYLDVDDNSLTELDLSNNTELTYFDLSYNNLTELILPDSIPELEGIRLNNNNLTELYLENSPVLSYVYCNDNNLTELDLGNGPELGSLYCYNNNLTELDVSGYPNLSTLFCYANNLTELNVSSNTELNTVYCDYNNLSTIDLSNSPELLYLSAAGMDMCIKVADIDYAIERQEECTTYNSSLSLTTACYYVTANSIFSLDCGEYIYGCTDENACNYIAGVDFDFDDGSCLYPPFGSDDCDSDCDSDGNGVCDDAEFTSVPDANFEAYLEANGMGDDVDNNQLVLTENIINVPSLDLYYQSIGDLTGIESFVSLVSLECDLNNLTELDLSNNTELMELNVYNNDLTELILSANTSLTYLQCSYNDLTELDVSSCPNLSTLYAYANDLTELDVSGCPNLYTLRCDDNDLTELDVSSCPNLYTLECDFNDLTELGVSGCPNLYTLRCDHNNLTELDVSSCPNLYTLECDFNDLTELDLSSNTGLYQLYCNDNNLTELILPTSTFLTNLYCNDNNLTELDLGNSPGLQNLHCYNNNLTELDLSNNVALSFLNTVGMEMCITVWDVDYAIEREENCTYNDYTDDFGTISCFLKNSNSVWSLDCGEEYTYGCTDENACNYDPMADFDDGSCLYPPFGSDDCDDDCDSDGNGICDDAEFTSVPDANFEAYLEANGMGDGVDNNQLVLTENVIDVVSLDVGSLGIYSLTGIEAFISLMMLSCDGNPLSELDLSNNTNLTMLDAGSMALTELDLSNQAMLWELYADYNSLTSMDLSNNSELIYLNLDHNSLTEINVSSCVMLNYLQLEDNYLTEIDLSSNTQLFTLDLWSNDLTELDVSNNLTLSYLYCEYNQLTELNVTNCPSLIYLYCHYNQLTELDLTGAYSLTRLYCYFNSLSELDVSDSPVLSNLYCDYNNLTALDVSNNTNLAYLTATGMNDLCIQVWDVDYAIDRETNCTTYWTWLGQTLGCFAKSNTAEWSLDCEIIITGCIDETACNYDDDATEDDGSCEYESCAGCTDQAACNFGGFTITDNDDCIYPDIYYDCDGDCLADADGDGVCDELEVGGCTDSLACNYDAGATDDDGSCEYAAEYYDCDGNCLNDIDNDGVCDEVDTTGCTDPDSFNYNPSATEDDGSCIPFIYGCTDPEASNYSVTANTDNGTCEYWGCLEPLACNYDADATVEDGSCYYCFEDNCDVYSDCNGSCVNDADSDGICDELEVGGCTDTSACNYNADATDDDGSCEYLDGVCETCEDGVIVDNDADDDDVCDEDDNCPDVFNPNQADLNADGIGDDCDGIGLNENGEFEWTIYPNPFKNYTTISFTNPANKKFTIKIISVSGKIIYERSIWSSEHQIINNFASGYYILQLESDDMIVKESLIIR